MKDAKFTLYVHFYLLLIGAIISVVSSIGILICFLYILAHDPCEPRQKTTQGVELKQQQDDDIPPWVVPGNPSLGMPGAWK